MARKYVLNQPASAAPSGPAIDYAAELNPQQLAAVTSPPGPALVIAGAGSGKTRTLTYRVAYLLENGIGAQNILLLTFTNKAAREMLERVSTLLPGSIAGLWSGTFHSVGNRILRRHATELGLTSDFSIMDREDQNELIAGVITSSGVDSKNKRFPKADVVAEIFSLMVNCGKTVEEVLDEKYPYFAEFIPQLGVLKSNYEARKKAVNSVDFDDLLEKTYWLLEQNEQLAANYRKRFQFVLVDEYQDTNRIQAEFIDVLVRESQSVMAVGDDAQSIYSWRGANFRNILNFPKRYPKATVYKIETNYRSVPEVLELANAAISHNTEQFTKQLTAARESRGLRPALVELGDNSQQALFVAQRILELREEGVELREIAVLYRSHYHSMEVQLELNRHGIPYQITSGVRFFEQAHIKDVTAFLRFCGNQRDEVAFKRIVKLLPGLGPKAADKLWTAFLEVLGPRETIDAFADTLLAFKVPPKAEKSWKQFAYTLEEIAPGGKPGNPPDMIESVLEAIYDDYAKAKFPNYDQRREDLTVLASYSRQYEDLSSFLAELALISNVDDDAGRRVDNETEFVTLTSVHQAKGLEWRVVFVIWLSDGMFPSSRSTNTLENLEEERRLFYVATTRAKDELYLTWPNMRLNAGYGEVFQKPSLFIKELPHTVFEPWEVSGRGSLW